MSEDVTTHGTAPRDEAEVPAEAECPSRRPLWQRILIGIAITVGLLALTAFALYQWGSMWVPSQAVKAEYAQLVAAGTAEPIEGRFHIPIPGCVCHSDDPVKTMEHSTRRISECMGCHGGR